MYVTHHHLQHELDSCLVHGATACCTVWSGQALPSRRPMPNHCTSRSSDNAQVELQLTVNCTMRCKAQLELEGTYAAGSVSVSVILRHSFSPQQSAALTACGVRSSTLLCCLAASKARLAVNEFCNNLCALSLALTTMRCDPAQPMYQAVMFIMTSSRGVLAAHLLSGKSLCHPDIRCESARQRRQYPPLYGNSEE